jgi:hypothetical protein
MITECLLSPATLMSTTLMQVTRKLAALCIQAQQRAADSFAQHKTCFALHLWLLQTRAAPRQSSVSASVWQQLQESGVLQHVPAILAGAADELDAVAALLAAGDGTVCGKGSRSSGRLVAEGSRADHALQGAQTALQVYYLGCSLAMVDSAGSFSYSPGLALPAAPAAVRLGLTALRVCSVPQLQAAPMSAVSATVTCVTRTTHDILLGITTTLLRVHVKAVSHPPGAKELLLSPHIMPCLAIMVVVGLLGLNIGSAAPASANLGSSGGSSSAGRNQQPRSTAAAGRAMMERWQTQLTLSGLAERLNPHLTTPLAASLFDMLGVDKDMAVKTAVVAYSGNGLSLERFRLLHDTYCEVLRYQVSGLKCFNAMQAK